MNNNTQMETVEEAAEKSAIEEMEAGNSAYILGFINSAKWQAERMYSEEDMKIAWTNGNNYHRGSLIASSQLTFEKTIEQFKKK